MKGRLRLLAALLCCALSLSLTACSALLDALNEPASSAAPASSEEGAASEAAQGGIPFAHTPEIPTVTLPEEDFADDLEAEAAALIDRDVAHALACVEAMKDDRHSMTVVPFEADADGLLAKLNADQIRLYERMVEGGRRFTAPTVTAEEYAGNLKTDFFALYEPMSCYAPDLMSWYFLEPVTRVRASDWESVYLSVSGFYFDPEKDANASVKSGAVTMDKVRHGAALLDRVVKRVVRFMPEGLTAYDRYYYLAAVLSNRVTYDKRPDNCFTAYGALIGGRAVCEGYAAAYWLLCREAGLWCAYRNGQPEGQGHAWNMVRLDSGIYNVDVTWCDNGVAPYQRDWYDSFMKSDADFADHAPTSGVVGTGDFEPNPYEEG